MLNCIIWRKWRFNGRSIVHLQLLIEWLAVLFQRSVPVDGFCSHIPGKIWSKTVLFFDFEWHDEGPSNQDKIDSSSTCWIAKVGTVDLDEAQQVLLAELSHLLPNLSTEGDALWYREKKIRTCIKFTCRNDFVFGDWPPASHPGYHTHFPRLQSMVPSSHKVFLIDFCSAQATSFLATGSWSPSLSIASKQPQKGWAVGSSMSRELILNRLYLRWCW